MVATPLTPRYMPRGHVYGGQLANDTDADHDVSCAAGEWISDDDDPDSRVVMRLTSSIVKRLDDTFAAGTGNGGLLSGSLANATWYFPWIIWGPGLAVDMVWHTSQTSISLPTGYTKKSLWHEGAGVLTNSSANILGFKNAYKTFRFNSAIVDSTTAPGTADPLQTVSVPPGFSVDWTGSLTGTNSSVAARLSIGDGIGTSGSDGGPYFTTQVAAVSVTVSGHTTTNTSGQIRWDSNTASNWSGIFLITIGWECLDV